MTTEQQKEFTEAIERRVELFKKYMEGYDPWDFAYMDNESRISELEWVLGQFNQIKNK